jgi:hypothetical protein
MTAVENSFAIFGAITLLASIVTLLDWWGRRKDAQRDVRR